jgi:hypothetical protein
MKFLSLALDMFYAEHEQDLRDATKSITNLLNLLPSPQPTIKPLHHFAVKNKFSRKPRENPMRRSMY